MKKQNKHPNQTLNIYSNYNKKTNNSNKDSSTLNIPFKPRFIVKDTSSLSVKDINFKPQRQDGTVSQICDNSPSYNQTRSNSFRKNWKQDYEKVSKQLENRTEKFDHIIDLCRNILTDIHMCTTVDQSQTEFGADQRLQYVRQKTQLLLQTFQMFRQKK